MIYLQFDGLRMAYNTGLSMHTDLVLSLVLTTGEVQQGYLLELLASENLMFAYIFLQMTLVF